MDKNFLRENGPSPPSPVANLLWPEESRVAAGLRKILCSRIARIALILLLIAGGLALWRGLVKLARPGLPPDDAVQLATKADTQYRLGNFEAASDLFTAALNLRTESGGRTTFLLGRGWSYLDGGRAAAALADFEEVLRISPEYGRALLGRAAALHRQGRVPEALVAYGEAIRSNPNLIEAHTGRALLFADLGEHEKASADMSDAIRLAPKDARWLVKRAQFRSAASDLEGALADLSLALRLNPEHLEANYTRAKIRREHGEEKRALAEIAQAIREHPNSATLFFVRALLHLEADEMEECVEDTAESIRLRKDFAPPYAIRAAAEFSLGDQVAALAFAGLATELDPSLAQPYQIRGRVAEGRQEFVEALPQFEKAMARNPEWIMPLIWHALTQAHAGFYALALKELEQTTGRFAGIADSHLMLAWFLASCPEVAFRNGTRAIAEAQTALKLSQGDASALDALAVAYAEAGEFNHAMEFERRAMDKTPARTANCARMESRLRQFEHYLPYRDY